MGRERFELCRKPSYINWNDFETWVRKTHYENSDSVLNTVRYAREYHEVLFHPNKAAELRTFSKAKRRLIMAALANLSRYLGIYDRWKFITGNFGLKYETRTGLETLIDILNSNMEDTEQWLIKAVSKLPKRHGTVLIFNALTGLRPSEGCLSCKLISQLANEGRLNDYLDSELRMLQHFKYREFFLRKNKNAYISFVSNELLELVLETTPGITYSGLADALNKKGFNNPLNKLRKLFATTLREHLSKEAIDLLQGRVSEDVFVRFYYQPMLKDLRAKTILGILPLQSKLLEAFRNKAAVESSS